MFHIFLGSQKKPWTEQRVAEVINEIKIAKETINVGLRRTSMEYYWMNKYEIITIENEESLILKKTKPQNQPIRILPREKYFDVLLDIHTLCKHGGRDKMLNYIKNKYYIPKKPVEIFVSLCPKCHTKRNGFKNEARMNVSKKLNIRGQVDLIDFQFCPDGDYNWLISYQDDATKYLNLRPLKTNGADEITLELMKIFLTFGAPIILQLDNRHEFVAQVTENLTAMWPECKVHKSHHIKGCKSEIERMLLTWMTDNHTKKWSIGCFVVQYEKNNICHRLNGKPYKALFTCDPKADFCQENVPASLLSTLKPDNELKIEPKQEPSDDVPGQSSDDEL